MDAADKFLLVRDSFLLALLISVMVRLGVERVALDISLICLPSLVSLLLELKIRTSVFHLKLH